MMSRVLADLPRRTPAASPDLCLWVLLLLAAAAPSWAQVTVVRPILFAPPKGTPAAKIGPLNRSASIPSFAINGPDGAGSVYPWPRHRSPEGMVRKPLYLRPYLYRSRNRGANPWEAWRTLSIDSTLPQVNSSWSPCTPNSKTDVWRGAKD